jgi:hypothetical protein
MSETWQTFETQCERVRFALDAADVPRTGPDPRLPDLVARVRSESLLVTSRTAPAIGRMAEQVAERLALLAPAEVYIRADSSINAMAPGLAHLERPIAILNSGLVALLTPAELAVALGHELGHVGLGHAHLPVRSPQNELDALIEKSRQRYAEISADRVGLLASRSTFLAANVMIKTASGLPSGSLGFDIPSFIAQMDRAPGELSREWELELSHPSLPFRLWALLRFSHSDIYAELSGQGGATIPIQRVDEEIAERLEAMGDGRLSGMEVSALERALTWLGAAKVLAAGISHEDARSALEGLIGASRAERVLDFAARFGADAVRAKAQEAHQLLQSTGPATRARFAEAMGSFLRNHTLTDGATGSAAQD